MREAFAASTAFLTAVAALAAADVAAAAVPGPRAVALAARRCGLEGIRARREGRRAFALEAEEYATTTTSVTVEEGPISPERERQIEAENERAGRPLRCLEKWARQRRLRLRWPMPPIGPIYD